MRYPITNFAEWFLKWAQSLLISINEKLGNPSMDLYTSDNSRTIE
jgi:hypothetical protein